MSKSNSAIKESEQIIPRTTREAAVAMLVKASAQLHIALQNEKDTKSSLELAMNASSKFGEPNPGALMVIAAAYAHRGNFSMAADLARRSLEVQRSNSLFRREAHAALMSFERNKIYSTHFSFAMYAFDFSRADPSTPLAIGQE